MTKPYEPELPRLIGNLKTLIDAYGQHTGNTPDNTIRLVLGHGTAQRIYIPDVDLYAGRYDKWVAKFSNCWPADLAWPDGIARPPVDVAAAAA